MKISILDQPEPTFNRNSRAIPQFPGSSPEWDFTFLVLASEIAIRIPLGLLAQSTRFARRTFCISYSTRLMVKGKMMQSASIQLSKYLFPRSPSAFPQAYLHHSPTCIFPQSTVTPRFPSHSPAGRVLASMETMHISSSVLAYGWLLAFPKGTRIVQLTFHIFLQYLLYGLNDQWPPQAYFLFMYRLLGSPSWV
jgi:hypothetical protein